MLTGLFLALACLANGTALEQLSGSAQPGPAPATAAGRALVELPAWPDSKRIDRALRSGAWALMGHQHRDGSWTQNANVLWNPPGVSNDTRSPITALAVSALERYGRDERGLDQAKKGRAFLLKHLLEDAERNTISARAYRLSYGLLWLLREPKSEARDALIYRMLGSIENLVGSSELNYYKDSPTSTFQEGLLLMALTAARKEGFSLSRTAETFLRSDLAASRQGHGGFPYYTGTALFGGANDGVGRNSMIELALYEAGASNAERLESAAEQFARLEHELRQTLKTGRAAHRPGDGWARYYYLFGMYWTVQAFKKLPADRVRPHAIALCDALLKLQASDGTWDDSPHFAGRSYGTATAMLVLMDLRELIERK